MIVDLNHSFLFQFNKMKIGWGNPTVINYRRIVLYEH